MGYLFIALSVFSGAAKGFCGKKISRFTSKYEQAMLANCVRMALCILIGFFVVLFDSGISALSIGLKTVGITALSGVATSVFVVTWLISARRGSYMMLDVFLTVGVVIPITLSAILFGEPIEWNHIVGLCLLLIAAALMCGYNNSIKARLTLSSFLLLVIAGVSNGTVSFSQKLYINVIESGSIAVFNFYTYVFSTITLLAVYIVTRLRKPVEQPHEGIEFENDGDELTAAELIKKTAPFIVVMAACLFAHTYFNTLAATLLTSAQTYPLMQGGALILSTLISALFFGERIKPLSVIGVILTFGGLLIINLL